MKRGPKNVRSRDAFLGAPPGLRLAIGDDIYFNY